MTDDTTLLRTAAHWSHVLGQQSDAVSNCWDLQAVHRHFNKRLSGNPDMGLAALAAREFIADRIPVDRVLSLGCGNGWLERDLASENIFRHCVAYDIAPGALKHARAAAAELALPIEYRLGDLNTLALSPGRYDAVFAHSVIHHMANLEHLIGQVRASLVPTGWFFLAEYMGPARFQFDARRVAMLNAALTLLPSSYRSWGRLSDGVARASSDGLAQDSDDAIRPPWTLRRLSSKLTSGRLMVGVRRRLELLRHRFGWSTGNPVLREVRLPTAEDVAAVDPSEAIRSDEIRSVLERHFVLRDVRELGFGLIQFLLADIAQNFVPETRRSRRMLQMILNIDACLTDHGDLPSDFVFIAAQPRSEV